LLQQKIVIKLGMPSAKNRKEAMALAAKVHGMHALVHRTSQLGSSYLK
jgi:hypothetical protein